MASLFASVITAFIAGSLGAIVILTQSKINDDAGSTPGVYGNTAGSLQAVGSALVLNGTNSLALTSPSISILSPITSIPSQINTTNATGGLVFTDAVALTSVGSPGIVGTLNGVMGVITVTNATISASAPGTIIYTLNNNRVTTTTNPMVWVMNWTYVTGASLAVTQITVEAGVINAQISNVGTQSFTGNFTFAFMLPNGS